MFKRKFVFFYQKNQMDCGPASLAMVMSTYGKKVTIEYLRQLSYLSREGVSILGISEAAQKVGFETLTARLSVDKLAEHINILPCIIYWNQNHFVVLRKITKSIISGQLFYHIADPAHGYIKVNKAAFCKSWLSSTDKGIALLLQPTEKLQSFNVPHEEKIKLSFLFGYLKPHKSQLLLLSFFLLLGSGLTLVFPFLTQALIDKGVNAKNLSYVWIILLAQLAVFLGSIAIDILRNWVMLFMGTNVSIKIISNFFKKLLQLPAKFFDTKLKGDFNQRIKDNERIEKFLTSQSLLTFLSVITFSVFFGVLWYYDRNILLIYSTLTILSLVWSYYWLRKRRLLDYYQFQHRSENQESIYEILSGVTEMKLNQFEDLKQKEWQDIQHKLFRINIRILKLDQLQSSGFQFLNQLKNIMVTFLASTYVIRGSMTLGELMSISYIIGQMNSPINQLVDFFRSLQEARLSLDRLNEVQNYPEEEQPNFIPLNTHTLDQKQMNTNLGITIKNLYFQYEGPKSLLVLNNVSLHIPEGKITAIVGASGSGKTTLLKLLMKFYKPVEGQILYGNDNLEIISPKHLRQNSGVVMQDGYIFSDTIQRNIATGDENIDLIKLQKAISIANLGDFILQLPLGLNTKIGASGNGLSGGQKQRLLIARAVYKNPHYLFFDEATSALDAENEKIIHNNLQSFFTEKTVIIIAHRLSTVKNADQILVMKNGQVVETGNHTALVELKNEYYTLVKNQLELGD